jgi:hypothetical protein
MFLVASINVYSQTPVYIQSTSCGYSFQDISGTGTALGLAYDGEANVTMPFSFSFYGTSSTALRVGNEGGILFNATTGNISSTNNSLSNGALAIFPLWTALYSAGDVYYQTIGSAPNRVFIIQWKVDHLMCTTGSGYLGNFQVQLYETSNIIAFLYNDLVFSSGCSSNNGGDATVGIRGTSDYEQFSYNTSFTNTCVSYTPCFPPSATISQNCASDFMTYSLDVQITSLGGATSANITDGTTTYFTNVGIGTYTINNLSTAKTIYVKDNLNTSCYNSYAVSMCDICTSTTLPDDECAGAPIIDLTQPFAGSTSCSYTVSAGSPSGCGTIENDSWMKFIASSTNVEMEFEVGNCSPINSGVQLVVFSGSCGALTALTGSCVNPTGELTTGTWNFSGLTIGNTYYIRIDGYAGDECPYWFTPVSGVVITPDNDLCADAMTLTCGGSDIASNILATNTDAPTACSGGGTTAKGVWYKFVGTGQSITISTDNAGTNFDTDINIYSGSCGSLTCVGGDTDSGAGTNSSYTFTATNGTTYYIYVDGNGTAQGQFELSITCVGCNANAGTWN